MLVQFFLLLFMVYVRRLRLTIQIRDWNKIHVFIYYFFHLTIRPAH